jgi:hypothetical protein
VSLSKRRTIWWVTLYQDGIPLYKSARTPDKRDAQRLHDIWAGQLRQGGFLPRADQTRYDELVEDRRTTGTPEPQSDRDEAAHAFEPGLRRRLRAKIDAAAVGRWHESAKREGGQRDHQPRLGS